MPMRDNDDIRNRMRPPSGVPPQRPKFINDVRPTGSRGFPTIGRSIPPARPVTRVPSGDIRTPRPQARPERMAVPVRPGQQPVTATAQPAARQPQTQAPAAPTTVAAPKPRVPKQKRRILTKKRVALVLIAVLLVGVSWFGFKIASNLQKVFHGSLFSVLTTTKLKGEDTGRVNILLAGNSADDPGHNGANLTDSIMLISLDVNNHTAFMLSIPRDLWVPIPGYGHAKINEAYVDGEDGNFSAPGYPRGGMGLLEEVVQQEFGIKANYYALINYDALKDSVNAVGGIDFTVQSSDPRGLYDPSIDWSTHGPLVRLTNGVHHLNGQQALDLSRARGDAYGSYGFPRSDFDRTEHQRELILALKAKILSAGTLANPITLGNLFDSIGKNINTDFSLSEIRRLYDISKDIKDSSIQSIGLNDANGVNYLGSYTSPTGQSALIPAAGMDDFSKIQAYLARLLTSNPIVREGASVVVLNGTDTSGLAASAETTLTQKDITVTAIGDAAAPVVTTTIIDASHGKMPATLSLLKKLYGKQVTTTNAYANVYKADFIIVLGSDQVPATPATH